MQIHRTAHPSNFTVLPNAVLQHRDLSLTARGLLGYLVSLPDNTHTTVQTITEGTAEGRVRVRDAMKELETAGYVTRVRHQHPTTGLWATDLHVFDVPTAETSTVQNPTDSNPGARTVGCSPKGVKNPGKNPPTPAPRDEEPAERADDEGGREEAPQQEDQAIGQAAAALARLGQAEPKLRLGAAEALRIAPLAAEWLARGVSAADLTAVLSTGLPTAVHSAAALITDRLTRKMPAVPQPKAPAPERHECAKCQAPGLSRPGICPSCATLATPEPSAPVHDSGEASGLLAEIRARRDAGTFAKGAKVRQPLGASVQS
ncbi:hypothetical protein GCM10009760_25850 [Kitasatospora kazusensis]|uniref:Helix-turn-helix domain-containing protein n=1 Tax=Kitasatospora kazusensis TaxID=407974 RepID=A0ABP5L6R3_9ACTN